MGGPRVIMLGWEEVNKQMIADRLRSMGNDVNLVFLHQP